MINWKDSKENSNYKEGNVKIIPKSDFPQKINENNGENNVENKRYPGIHAKDEKRKA